MKTKELIKLLQKEDPTGELHVRTQAGGAVIGVERKEGYWDGHYSYIDGEEYVISSLGEKIDLLEIDYEEWIMDHNGDYSKIRLDIGNYLNYEEYEREYLNKFKEISEDHKKIEQSLRETSLFEIIKMIAEGWKIIETPDDPPFNIRFKKGLRSERPTTGKLELIRKSGFFEKVGKEWRIKNG
jgi:hypothetical protein